MQACEIIDEGSREKLRKWSRQILAEMWRSKFRFLSTRKEVGAGAFRVVICLINSLFHEIGDSNQIPFRSWLATAPERKSKSSNRAEWFEILFGRAWLHFSLSRLFPPKSCPKNCAPLKTNFQLGLTHLKNFLSFFFVRIPKRKAQVEKDTFCNSE